jgi:phosphoribosylformylglycinamidine synthase subunit PurQ / glutaminase
MTLPPVLILHATGTNRDREAAWAVELAGGAPEIVHVNQLVAGERHLADYKMLVLPGGFSYGDDLGAGRLWALDMLHRLADSVAEFTRRQRPVLGVCNGFQALVKAGVLPGGESVILSVAKNLTRPFANAQGDKGAPARPLATLTRNERGRFECRWVWLRPQPASRCLFTQGLAEPIYCPVAHGEGNFVPRDEEVLRSLQTNGQIALTYVAPDGGAAAYPWNPNGSVADIAGICDASGTVLGVMPHPEDHILPEQRPDFARGGRGNLGLVLWQKAVAYATEV